MASERTSVPNQSRNNWDGGVQRILTDQSMPKIASTTKDKRMENTSPSVIEDDRWEITKNDFRMPSSTALKVMDKADVVLRQRLAHAAPELGVDICRFETSVARICNSEIQLGRRLAFGNFSDIHCFQFKDSKATRICTKEQHEAADELKKACNAESFVVKLLRAQLLGDPKLYSVRYSLLFGSNVLFSFCWSFSLSQFVYFFRDFVAHLDRRSRYIDGRDASCNACSSQYHKAKRQVASVC